MHMKKVTQKDRYGNSMTYEFEVPERPLDPTTIITKQMELDAEAQVPEMMMMTMDSMMPPVMGEEFNMGDPNNHPGEPRGQDTVPAWLTPGEFVVNKEATEMFGPEIEAMNEVGRMAKGGQVDGYNRGGNVRGSAAQIMAGKDPADIVRMLGTLGNAYQYVAPALGLNEGGDIPMPVSMQDALLHSREGFRPDVYLDSLGKPTVGYGHLLPDSYKQFEGQEIIGQEQLDKWYNEDRDKAIAEAKSNVGEEAWNKLNKRQQATMASMAFQLGGSGQRKFENLLKAVKAGDHREVAKQALTGSKGGRSLWLKQTPVRALDLAEAFDPEIAAQYRNAGGQVYDDAPGMMAQYRADGGWLSKLGGGIANILGTDVPEAGVLQIPEGDHLNMHNAMYPENPAGVPPVLEMPDDEVSVTNDMGLLGDVVDLFGGPSGVAQVEAEERAAQQSRAGLHVENAQQSADVAAANLEQAQAALEEIPLTEVEARDEARESVARLEEHAAAAAAAVPVYEAQQAEDITDFAVAQVQAELDDVEEAIGIVTNEEDKAALEAEKARLEGELVAAGTPEPVAKEPTAEETAATGASSLIQKITEADTTAAGGTPAGTPPPADAGTGKSEQEILAAGGEALANEPNATEKVRGLITETLEGTLGEGVGTEIGNALGSMFDAGELAKMAVYVAGSMAFGASPMNAIGSGLQMYLGKLDSKTQAAAAAQAKRDQQAVTLANSGNYTAASVEKFRRTGNISDLATSAKGSKIKPAKITDTKVVVPGEGLRQVWDDGTGRQFYKDSKGKFQPVVGSGARVYNAAAMGDNAIKSEFKDWVSSEVGVLNAGIEEGKTGYVSVNPTDISNEANQIFQKMIRDSSVPVDDAEALKGNIGNAINQYLAAKKAYAAGDLDEEPQSLRAFVDANVISKVVGISQQDLMGVSVKTQYKLNERIRNELKAEGVPDDQVSRYYGQWWQAAQAAWATVPKEAREKFGADAQTGENGFTRFMTRLINDDEEALKYLPQ